MFTYILRRLLLMVPTVIGITMVVFFVMALSPGGPGASLINNEGNMRPAEREAVRRYLNQRYGLDKPLIVQYGKWLGNVLPIGFKRDPEGNPDGFGFKAPDLGHSFIKNRPVFDMVAETLPITLLLNLITIPLVYSVAITAGIYAARHRGQAFDITTGVTFIGLWSLPVMWVGVMMLGFLANRDFLHAFPTGGVHATEADQLKFLPSFNADGWQRGWLLDTVWHLVLPIACLTYGGFAFLSKLMRASMLENLSADFARTARAKGVTEHLILFRHVLRNSVIPLITVAAGILPSLLGGSVIVESIFSIRGMGKLMVDSIKANDNEVVLSVTLVGAVLGTLCVLLADLCYAIADPRVSYK